MKELHIDLMQINFEVLKMPSIIHKLFIYLNSMYTMDYDQINEGEVIL